MRGKWPQGFLFSDADFPLCWTVLKLMMKYQGCLKQLMITWSLSPMINHLLSFMHTQAAALWEVLVSVFCLFFFPFGDKCYKILWLWVYCCHVRKMVMRSKIFLPVKNQSFWVYFENLFSLLHLSFRGYLCALVENKAACHLRNLLFRMEMIFQTCAIALVLLWWSSEAEVLVNRHWDRKSICNTFFCKFRDLWVIKKQQISLPLNLCW